MPTSTSSGDPALFQPELTDCVTLGKSFHHLYLRNRADNSSHWDAAHW